MSEAMINLLVTALGDTLLMVFASALFGCLLGLPLGVALHVTKAGQILANPALNKLLGILVNIGRSVPFIILLVAIIPLTRLIVGTSIGTIAAIVPLTIGAVPFIAVLWKCSYGGAGRLLEAPRPGGHPCNHHQVLCWPEAARHHQQRHHTLSLW